MSDITPQSLSVGSIEDMDKCLVIKPEPSASTSTTEATTSDHNKKIIDLNPDTLPSDPGLRPPIFSYPVDQQDLVRRAYLQRGPCQPHLSEFPWSSFGNKRRRFNKSWYNIYKEWLEYSVEKDAVFCLYCYLFGSGRTTHGWDAFTLVGFRNWKMPEKLRVHVGGYGSAHNAAVRKCENLLRSKRVETVLANRPDLSLKEYKIMLRSSLEAIRYLLRKKLAFRRLDETSFSRNQENFLEFLIALANDSDEIKNVVFGNAQEDHKTTPPYIQKDLVSATAMETTNAIIKDIDDEYFAILVDKSYDISMKEYMTIVLRYVNKEGEVIECFMGMIHVENTNASTLKAIIEAIFSRFGLGISKLRGQGYDGATDMRGEFDELKALFLQENTSAYYIGCFAHQLESALIDVGKKHAHLNMVFSIVSMITHVVEAYVNRSDIIKESQVDKILKALECAELTTGNGFNRERVVKHGDTQWNSHFLALVNLIHLYPFVLVTLESICDDENGERKGDALLLLEKMGTFEFACSLHLMRDMLEISFDLSYALQTSDQDIVTAMDLVRSAKLQLESMRQGRWESFLLNVSSFCSAHDIDVPDMNEIFVPYVRSRCTTEQFSNLHHYRYDLFNSAIDRHIQELDNRFAESSSELLLCMACLRPVDSFKAFDKEGILRLAEFYPCDFSSMDIQILSFQLDSFIHDVRLHPEFQELKSLADLAKTMVKTKKHEVFHLIYRLLKLTLVVPVSTASAKRVFSMMNVVERELRNQMGDQWLINCLVTFIESRFFATVSNDVIMEHF